MHRYDSGRRRLAFGIAGLAGFVDATGFLAANNYFVSFMSGNTTRLGVDLATRLPRAIVPAALIAGFVAGVTIGALLAERAGDRRKTAVLGLALALLAGAAALRTGGSGTGFLALSVLAMGVLNNSFRRDREVAVGVTYMTGALVRLGQGIASRLSGHHNPGWSMNFVLWLCLAAGAFAGAMVADRASAASAWVAVVGAAILLAAAWRIEVRDIGTPG